MNQFFLTWISFCNTRAMIRLSFFKKNIDSLIAAAAGFFIFFYSPGIAVLVYALMA